MRVFRLALAIAIVTSTVLAKPLPVSDSPAGIAAFDDLAKFYKNQDEKPPLESTFKALAATDPAKRSAASEYLTAFFAQSLADESNGRTEWNTTPFWIGRSRSVTRDIRIDAAREFAEAGIDSEEAIAPALWLIQHDPDSRNPELGMQALKAISSPAISSALKQLLNPPDPHPKVLAGAIDEAWRRNLQDFAPLIATFRADFRPSVRAAARNRTEPPPFEPPQADSQITLPPEVIRDLEAFAEMVPVEIPAGASLHHFRWRSRDFAESNRAFSGWIISQTPDQLKILDWFGDERTIEKADVDVTDSSLALELERFGAARADAANENRRGAPEALSRLGAASAQFEVDYITLPEALIAAWAWKAGDRAAASAILSPRYDDAPDIRWINPVIATMLGNIYRDRVLNEFAYLRDYEVALRFAGHLANPLFNVYFDQARMKELAGQLRDRKDTDFKTLTLPGESEWTQLQKSMSRAAQAEFLARRLRLLNCFQMGQPGGVEFNAPIMRDVRRYLPPRPGEERAAIAYVVNPLVELEKLNLTVAELTALIPFLSDANFVPSYGYWRDFHPDRQMYRVYQFIGHIIDRSARTGVVEPFRFAKEPASQIADIDRVKAWILSHANQSAAELGRDSVLNAPDIENLQQALERLANLDPDVATECLIRRIDTWGPQRADAIRFAREHLPTKLVTPSRRWVSDPDKDVRFWASLILLRHGDRTNLEGFETLRPILIDDFESSGGTKYFFEAFDDLMFDAKPKAVDLAASVLPIWKSQDRFFSDDESRVLRALLLAGRKDALEFVLERLRNATVVNTSAREVDGKPVESKWVIGDRIAWIVVDFSKGKAKFNEAAPDDERAKMREQLAVWLINEFKQLDAIPNR